MKLTAAAAAALSLLVLPGCVSPDEEEAHSTKILMIGNSFSVSLMKDIPRVADSLAIDLDITSLYVPGCSLKRHMDNVKREWNIDHKPYSYTRNIRNQPQEKQKVNLPEVLDGEVSYDIITIQQASHESWDPATYEPYGSELLELIRKHQPQAKVYVQETWSYTPFDKRLAKWGFDQNEMYSRLHDAYAAFAKRHGLDVIPMGRAVQLWRQRKNVRYGEHSFGGDVVGGRFQLPEDQFKRLPDNTWQLNSDAFHLNEKGEYFQSLVWIAKLFNEDVTACEYAPENLEKADVQLMKEIANELR